MNKIFNNNPHNAFANYFGDEKTAPFLYALSKKMEAGNICVDIKKMDSYEEDFWSGFNDGVVLRPSGFEINEKIVSKNLTDIKPFVLYNNKLYTHRYFFYETSIINKLKELCTLDSEIIINRKNSIENNTSFIEKLQSADKEIDTYTEDEKPDWQLVATIQGVLNNLTVITGGPGTGKTTTVAKILALLNKIEPGIKVALTAPTGKAAIRMKESLIKSSNENKDLEIGKLIDGLNPKTMHSLLGANYQSPFF